MIVDKHSLQASTREEYVEYIFLGELCSYGWNSNRFIEILRAKTDAFGYDLVLSLGGYTRHVQLKASKVDSKTEKQNVNLNLAQKDGGCVIWLKVDAETLRPCNYGWIGGSPGEKLPPLGGKVAKHNKGDATGHKSERPNIRVCSWSKFEKLSSIDEVFLRLFGPKLGAH